MRLGVKILFAQSLAAPLTGVVGTPRTEHGVAMPAIKQFLKQFKVVRDLYGHLHPQAPLRDVDLQAIENLSLPNNDKFQKTAESAERIEGMFSPFSIAAVDMMLSLQESLGAKGDILEIGFMPRPAFPCAGGMRQDLQRPQRRGTVSTVPALPLPLKIE